MMYPVLCVYSVISFLLIRVYLIFVLFYKEVKMILKFSYVTVQAAQQERSTFISSLLPLLSEYDNFQRSVLDARSIVSNLKVCFVFLCALQQRCVASSSIVFDFLDHLVE
jgi:hypothetical protein